MNEQAELVSQLVKKSKTSIDNVKDERDRLLKFLESDPEAGEVKKEFEKFLKFIDVL